jgi:hypothetical protein
MVKIKAKNISFSIQLSYTLLDFVEFLTARYRKLVLFINKKNGLYSECVH